MGKKNTETKIQSKEIWERALKSVDGTIHQFQKVPEHMIVREIMQFAGAAEIAKLRADKQLDTRLFAYRITEAETE